MQRVDPNFSKEEKEFYDACELARHCDPRLVKRYPWYGLPVYHGVSLAKQMAFEGNAKAVEFLRNNFHFISMLDIAEGYARAGEVGKVNVLLTDVGRMNYAVRGYAFAGFHAQVNDLLVRGAGRRYAMGGYARGGFTQEAYTLRTEEHDFLKYDEDVLCYNFACAGLHTEVNKIILSAHNELFQTSVMWEAMRGYKDIGLYQNEQFFLDVMLAACGELRSYIKATIAIEMPRAGFDVKLAFEKVEAIEAVMDEYQINARQAQVLRQQGVRETILHTDKAAGLSHDTTLQIFSHKYGLSYQETKGLFETVCQNTHRGANQLLLSKHYGAYFADRGSMNGEMRPPHKKHKVDRDELDKRYDDRKSRRIGK